MVADEQGRYCVVFVNKDESRLLMISMGNVEEDRSISDEVPGRHDQGGWSQARYQRHHDFHVVEHLKRTLTALNDYLKSRPFQRLIVAGPEEVAAEFTSLLPTPLMDRLVATVPSPARVSREEMMEAIMPAIEGFERSEEEALIHRVSELADAGGNAVLGMETTLRAVGDGRVHELALAEGISAAGQECLGCGYLDAENLADCPRCGSRLERVEDIVERAAESVYAQGGRVEVLFGEARESLIARGGLGALLRF
jgi:peptide chain release factor subunit 1